MRSQNDCWLRILTDDEAPKTARVWLEIPAGDSNVKGAN